VDLDEKLRLPDAPASDYGGISLELAMREMPESAVSSAKV
jgi:hypothetical protein